MSQLCADDDDLAFEQRLLDAGLAEALPTDRTEGALLRFAADVAAVQGGVVGGAAGASVVGGASAGSRRLLALKWLTLGALVGGSVALMSVRHTVPPSISRAPNAAVASTNPSRIAQDSAARRNPVEVSLPTRPVHPTEAHRGPRSVDPASVAPTARALPDLAAEVAALDGIHTALAIGAWQDAEEQLARYRRGFARGALGSEAEVLWIETLLGQGKRSAAASAAERFIARHPRDPQVARMRALVE